jgi:protein-S-isoprenylcysteine O-methyltransferase Ste14
MRDKLSATSFRRLDIIGAFLLLAASILLVFGFEEAGTKFPWQSPVIVSTIVLGVVVLAGFIFFEIKLGKVSSTAETMLPLRLFKERQFIGLLTCGYSPAYRM